MLPAAKPTCSGMVISGVASTGLGATTSAFLGIFLAGLGFLEGALVSTAATGCSAFAFGAGFSGVVLIFS